MKTDTAIFPRKWAIKIISIGILLSAITFGSILVGSNGLEPNGVCDFVEGSDGLLPLNPNLGGTIIYSCDPNWGPLVFRVFILGLVISMFLGVFWIAFRRISGVISAMTKPRKSKPGSD